MFDCDPYEIHFIQKDSVKSEVFHHARIYKFFGDKRIKYIVRAEFFDKNEVYAVKFYLARDRKRDDKYHKLSNCFDGYRIIVTCAKILYDLTKTNPNASLCLCASRSIDKVSNKIEPLCNNQRYRIYKCAVGKFVGVEKFEHYAFDEVSSYLLVNRAVHHDTEAHKDAIKDMFLDIYKFYDDV